MRSYLGTIPKALSQSAMFRYLLTAFINTLIGLSVISCIYTMTNMPYLTVGLSAGLGYLYSLFTYFYIAFRSQTESPPYMRYAAVYFTAFALNSSLTWIGMSILKNFIVVQIFVLPIVVILQWVASNRWAFRIKS